MKKHGDLKEKNDFPHVTVINRTSQSQEQKEGEVGKDDKIKGTSAREQNQKDMNDKIKDAEKEIKEIANQEIDQRDIRYADPEAKKEAYATFLKKSLRKRLEHEQKLKDQGDVGPGL